MGTNEIFKGSPFWQEIRTGLFVIQDYDWKKTLLAIPGLLDADEIEMGLQDHQQILETKLGGVSIVKGERIEASPNGVILSEGLPTVDHYNVEALFLQWLYQFFILEGFCQHFWGKPLKEWPQSIFHLAEQSLHFLTYIAAVMCLLEEGVIKGAPTKDGMHDLKPMVQARITKITETLLSKTHDYGESYRRHGLQGTIPRLWDKIARYAQLSALGREANYEPKADAVKDLLGYSVIAWSLMLEVQIEDILATQTSKDIFVNGTKIPLLRDSVSYEDLVEHVYGAGSKAVPTVVYKKKSGSGTIHRGQAVPIEDGMKFDVIITNCA